MRQKNARFEFQLTKTAKRDFFEIAKITDQSAADLLRQLIEKHIVKNGNLIRQA